MKNRGRENGKKRKQQINYQYKFGVSLRRNMNESRVNIVHNYPPSLWMANFERITYLRTHTIHTYKHQNRTTDRPTDTFAYRISKRLHGVWFGSTNPYCVCKKLVMLHHVPVTIFLSISIQYLKYKENGAHV